MCFSCSTCRATSLLVTYDVRRHFFAESDFNLYELERTKQSRDRSSTRTTTQRQTTLDLSRHPAFESVSFAPSISLFSFPSPSPVALVFSEAISPDDLPWRADIERIYVHIERSGKRPSRLSTILVCRFFTPPGFVVARDGEGDRIP